MDHCTACINVMLSPLRRMRPETEEYLNEDMISLVLLYYSGQLTKQVFLVSPVLAPLLPYC